MPHKNSNLSCTTAYKLDRANNPCRAIRCVFILTNQEMNYILRQYEGFCMLTAAKGTYRANIIMYTMCEAKQSIYYTQTLTLTYMSQYLMVLSLCVTV